MGGSASLGVPGYEWHTAGSPDRNGPISELRFAGFSSTATCSDLRRHSPQLSWAVGGSRTLHFGARHAQATLRLVKLSRASFSKRGPACQFPSARAAAWACLLRQRGSRGQTPFQRIDPAKYLLPRLALRRFARSNDPCVHSTGRALLAIKRCVLHLSRCTDQQLPLI